MFKFNRNLALAKPTQLLKIMPAWSLLVLKLSHCAGTRPLTKLVLEHSRVDPPPILLCWVAAIPADILQLSFEAPKQSDYERYMQPNSGYATANIQ